MLHQTLTFNVYVNGLNNLIKLRDTYSLFSNNCDESCPMNSLIRVFEFSESDIGILRLYQPSQVILKYCLCLSVRYTVISMLALRNRFHYFVSHIFVFAEGNRNWSWHTFTLQRNSDRNKYVCYVLTFFKMAATSLIFMFICPVLVTFKRWI